MKNYNYSMGSPLKVEFNTVDRVINCYLPGSNEITYPIDIQYYIFNMESRWTKEKEIIYNAEEYTKAMKHHQECRHQIISVGMTCVSSLTDYIYCINKYIDDILSKITLFPEATFVNLPDEKTKFASLFTEDFSEIKKIDEYMKERLIVLKSKLPTGTHTVYPTN